jgi:hypothetical protein
MSHAVYPSSGPDDTADVADYEDASQLRAESDIDSDNDSARRRQRKQPSSSSAQQVNHIKQAASNARSAAASAASHSLSAEETREQHDLRLITLVKRYEKKLNDLNKREREIDGRERASSSKSTKRSKSSRSRRHRSDSSDSSDSDSSNIGDMGDNSDSDNDGHGRRSSSSNGLDGKDISLRQLAVLHKFVNLSYVDISVFSRANLNVRKARKLVPIKSSVEYSAAWASYNVELQQYLINANRGDDALMVTKYYSQIVRLLTDYSSQWQLVKDLDEYVRGESFTVNDHIVWSIDHDDDHVSQYKYDIRFKHQDATSRVHVQHTPSTQRGTHSNVRRSSGAGSNSTISAKPRRTCYAYNGDNGKEWTNANYCRGAEQCKFTHRCIVCKAEGHAAYESAECLNKPRIKDAVQRRN